MTDLKAKFAASIAKGFQALGTTVTFKGTEISAIVSYGEDNDGRSIFEIMDLTVMAADVPAPAYRDKAVVVSETWYFWKQIKRSHTTKTLRFRRKERPRVGR